MTSHLCDLTQEGLFMTLVSVLFRSALPGESCGSGTWVSCFCLTGPLSLCCSHDEGRGKEHGEIIPALNSSGWGDNTSALIVFSLVTLSHMSLCAQERENLWSLQCCFSQQGLACFAHLRGTLLHFFFQVFQFNPNANMMDKWKNQGWTFFTWCKNFFLCWHTFL